MTIRSTRSGGSHDFDPHTAWRHEVAEHDDTEARQRYASSGHPSLAGHEKVFDDGHGGYVVRSTEFAGGNRHLPLQSETRMSEPDAFGRVRRVHSRSGAMVNNRSNEAAKNADRLYEG